MGAAEISIADEIILPSRVHFRSAHIQLELAAASGAKWTMIAALSMVEPWARLIDLFGGESGADDPLSARSLARLLRKSS